MPEHNTPRVVFQPATRRGIQRGINQLVNAVRPTLGPRPRAVAIDNVDYHDKTPRSFDDGGAIARHIIQLRHRDADMGAMLIRDLLWRLQQQVGDGTATAAVVFQTVFNEGVRYLTAGGNAMQLQLHLQQGLRIILQQLTRMTVRLQGKEQLAQLAETLCYDPPLARYMGEIFDIIGEHGRLEVRAGRSRDVEREYVEGMYWNRGLVSREMHAEDGTPRMDFQDAAILISDLVIDDVRHLLPPLEVALQAKIPSLLIVAEKLSDNAIGFLLTNQKPDQFQVVAVRTPGVDRAQRAAALEDLAILTGGRSFIQVAGDTFDGIRPEDFGRARRAWADRQNFGIVGGKGDPRALRQHIAMLRNSFDHADVVQTRDALQARIGKLLGGSATLWVGGPTEIEIEARVEVAKRTASAMRGAIMEGVLPGGGVALLACRPALQEKLDKSTSAEERAAYRILIRAVEEPFRTIVSNAGHDDSDVMAEIRLAGPGYGFDVKSAEVIGVMQAGIYDAVSVQKAALFGAIGTASMALTVDVLVQHAEPEQASLPEPAKRKWL